MQIAAATQEKTGTEQVAGVYGRLMSHAAGLPNDDLLARMLASQVAGAGALPPGLGLEAEAFAGLLVRHFPHTDYHDLPHPAAGPVDRLEERQDLIDLMLEHRAGLDPSEISMAHVVAAACMAGDHLWQDLGLWARGDLSRLMTGNFPLLAGKNVKDMKWKKFLYKQLCQREGMFVCRAPSCEVCADYSACFGPED